MGIKQEQYTAMRKKMKGALDAYTGKKIENIWKNIFFIKRS